MAEPPRIERYSLVRDSRGGGVTRLHLARRLERMENVAARERQGRNGGPPSGGGGRGRP